MKSAVLCVNSTVRATRSHFVNGQISPLHHWGYVPKPGDMVLGHRQNRVEIRLRHLLGGTDISIAVQTFYWLVRGIRIIYLVTQPDFIRLLPLFRWMFPTLKVITWVWTAEEVVAWKKALITCSHVFALTDVAFNELKRQGMGASSSLGIWGCDPEYYARPDFAERVCDVLFLGVANRDLKLLNDAAKRADFRIAGTGRALRAIGDDERDCLDLIDTPKSYPELVRSIWGSRVCIIPIKMDDPYPTGFTNLIEALLCGCAVVIADCSRIPYVVLQLPGVYLYRTGDVDDFMQTTETALGESSNDGFRTRVRAEASKLLDGEDIGRIVEKVSCISDIIGRGPKPSLEL